MSKSILLFGTVCCGVLFAQGSGSTEPAARSKRESPFTVTRVARGKVLQPVTKGEMFLEVDGTKVALRITDDTAVVAEKGVTVKDPERVTTADLKPNQLIRVKYRAKDETALEVVILKAGS